jgi:hypothetical protein
MVTPCPVWWSTCFRFAVCGCLVFAFCSSVAAQQVRPHREISQLIERRGGRLSCWGVIIRPRGLRFLRRPRSAELTVTDGKHGANLRDIMTWAVDRQGAGLVVRFRPGMGDFGTGNTVTVTVAQAVLRGGSQFAPESCSWTIATDRM